MGSEVLALKDRGNACLKSQDYAGAVEHYSAALALLEGAVESSSTTTPQPHILHSNRSAAYYFLGDFVKALEDGEACVKLAPEWAKGYSRAGSALFAAGRLEEAAKMYIVGLTKDPTNLGLSQGLAAVQQAYKSRKDDEKMGGQQGSGEEKQEVVVGIDLGTTYSCVSVWKDDGVVIIPNEEGHLTTPSVVGFSADGERLVGRSAQRQASTNPKNTVYDIKRILGQSFDDHSVQKEIKRFPFKVEANSENKPVVVVEENGQISRYMPEQISAMVLGKMKQVAESFLGQTVTKAVITVPAYFNDAQRQATKDAGAIAGLQVLRIINEPTAAALAYGLDKAKTKEEAVVLVFDLGGGTFDVSVLAIEGGIFQVKSTGGDTHLGGEDFDYALFDYVCEQVKKQHKDVTLSPRAEKRIKLECERVKRLISTNQNAQLVLESILPGIDLSLPITRSKFESLNKKPFQKCLDTVKQVLKASKYTVEDVDDVVLIGGSTRIPKVQEMLQQFFQGKQLCKSINPDEAVAYGAGVQGAILSGAKHEATTDLLLFDVTPMTLGIEVQGKIFAPIIPRNSTVPVTKTKTFTTTENYQRVIEIPIYEGERSNVEGNNLLGEFEIRDIEHAKMGVPQIEVTFSVDTNGILKVKARDKVTNSSAQTCIANNRGRLSKEEIERMLAEAERYKDEDRKRLERVELRNAFEAMLYQVKDRASETRNSKLQALCEENQQWMDSHLNATFEELNAKKVAFEQAYQMLE